MPTTYTSDTDPNLPVQIPTCSRCGLPFGDQPNHCGDFTGDGLGDAIKSPELRLQARIACREREIGNLRALLRGSTRHLERCMQTITDVLEMWS